MAHDEIVTAEHMRAALTAGTLVFGDGATQVFTSDGHTTYTEDRRPTRGDWWIVGDGEFASFWPPDYRASYALRWRVDGGAVTGLTFIETRRGTRFEGRYL
ncbi:hypothetical protein SAMN04487968_1203 [Nocardioides terrae]|uniref:Uncharacterized protein n=1 Tax=Nocardioides terrae TaxID=574651 RepID=A0A1I1NZZ6_9ACTN|nr:hypothetical protein [Nocardioides terrae]SFD00283.1 hypothetical protein SAMN04487968_1203 [Nocardioides terrae]